MSVTYDRDQDRLKQTAHDHISSDKIILDGNGPFPKKVIIIEKDGSKREYVLRKTSKGKYLFN